MLSSKRPRARPAHVLGPIARVLIIAFAASAAGCSSDITRFAINGPSQTTSSIPVPPEPVGNGYAPASRPRGLGLTEAPLPPVSEPSGGSRYGSRDFGAPPPPYQSEPPPRMAAAPEPSTYRPPSYEQTPSEPPGNYRVVGRQYKTPPPPATSPPGSRVAAAPDRSFEPPSATAGGQTIEVQPGETLYSIGRRYGVPPDAIKDANRLSSNVVRPGDRLVIPASGPERGPFAAQLGNRGPAVASAPAAAPFSDRAPAGRTAMADAAEPPGAEPPPGWTGRHTLRNAESLSAVATRHKVSLEELKRANGITDPAKVWAGTVLHVPEQSAAPVADAGARAPQTPPRVINATPEPDRRVASRGDISNDAEPAGAETVASKFRWPVRGRVIAGFGRRPDGTNNDGVNVAVPQGTEIHAAESGKVVYAGNELKGYGNLVLIRHPNGWVTAYAHADRLLVKANDEVRRGQAIATAGRTGSVDQPQLHFELRQGSRPVDPVPHLAN